MEDTWQDNLTVMNHKVVIALSLVICILVGGTSYMGISIPNFYSKETINWQTQSIGQDFINLYLIVPSLLITVMVYIKWRESLLIWVGVMIYLLYTYMIYCFNIHFNILFLGYCAILGLSFYLIACFFYYSIKEGLIRIIKPRYSKITGIYFLCIAGIFYMLWLSDIIHAILNNKIPRTTIDAGVFTNPVHVIDLAIFLPGVFIIGILLLRNHKVGFLFTPAILTFFVLMNSTIGVLSLMMSEDGLVVTIVMSVLGLFSSILLMLNFSGNNIYERRTK